MRAGDDDRADCSAPTSEAESSAQTAGASATSRKAPSLGRRLAPARRGPLQGARHRGTSSRGGSRSARRRVGVGDDAARHHVGAVADARGVVADGGGGNAEPFEIIEPADPGLVAPDPGIVEDRRGDPQLAAR